MAYIFHNRTFLERVPPEITTDNEKQKKTIKEIAGGLGAGPGVPRTVAGGREACPAARVGQSGGSGTRW